ncbi:MAG: HAD family hydrolase [Eubacteriales bacterium]|nr:HAD family hydrolase [Eubacteriales bacterium]
MKKKYFFFDIDGTLTDRATNKIVPSAAEALKKLRAAGHFVAVNTGRAHYKARKFFDENGFDNMVCNGGKAIVVNRELVENSPLFFENALRLYNEAVGKGYGVLVSDEDSELVRTRDFRFYEQAGIRKEPTRYVIDEKYTPEEKGIIYKLYISIPQMSEEALLQLLPSVKPLGHVWFEPEYLLVQQDCKKEGILRMLEIVGGDPEDVVVFGDDLNDLDMFAPGFFKIAMGNGHPDLKAVADQVAPSNVEDGIYRICQENGWF